MEAFPGDGRGNRLVCGSWHDVQVRREARSALADVLQRAASAARPAERSPQFAHPVERALARVFDRLGIEWRYEPHTFVLEREHGKVLEAWTPDFYLPELDMYVECTVMKQKLATRKNRKYRKLRERFGVVVEIMYLRDFVRLGRRHGLIELERAARPRTSALD